MGKRNRQAPVSKLSVLKPVRVVVSLIFLVFTALVFLDFESIFGPVFISTVVYLQFIPSFLKFISYPLAAAAGFIFILVLTVLFGRVYCSSICPLGTLMDLISNLSKKFKWRKKYTFSKPHNILRYGFLILTILTLVSGTLLIINLLDPYSNFGRMMADLLRPAIVELNNLGAVFLEERDIFWLSQTDMKGIRWELLLFPISFLILIITMSIRHGRLYCNTVCPVGAFLGLVSKVSIFRLVIDQTNCTSCGLCEKECKAKCLDQEAELLDLSRCVACFNCIKACNLDGFKYEIRLPFIKTLTPVVHDTSKRDFLNKSAIIAGTGIVAIAGSGLIKAYNKIKESAKSQPPVTPPGAVGTDNFITQCTACHLCVSACPTEVLQPSFLEYGLSGILQPRMDYHTSFCNYECTICGEICPSGAILPLEKEVKKFVQVGRVQFIKEICIVVEKRTDCGSCSEHCPTKAVQMVPWEEGLFIPEINPEICIGCGACEYACPTVPDKAIWVLANEVHKTAEKPVFEELKDEDTDDDFPF